jgi:peptide/nickel transport system permease protein
MKLRLCFLAALLLPELPLDPFRASLPCSWAHPMGTDPLGREALLRLLHASARSCGFASAVALGAVAFGMALGLRPGNGARSALRMLPPLLYLIPLAALLGDMGWLELGLLLSLLMGLHLEPPLRARLSSFTTGSAWRHGQVLGAGMPHRVRFWAPWFLEQGAAIYPSAWIGALWGEATLRALGLGPGPHHDSLGLLLQEELPRLATNPTPLGWGTLLVSLGLAAASKVERQEHP